MSSVQLGTPSDPCPSALPYLNSIIVSIGVDVWSHPRSCHVRAANGFDLGDTPELGLVQELCKSGGKGTSPPHHYCIHRLITSPTQKKRYSPPPPRSAIRKNKGSLQSLENPLLACSLKLKKKNCQSWLSFASLGQEELQKTPRAITFGSPESTYSETAASIIEGCLAAIWESGPQFLVALAPSPRHSESSHRHNKMRDPCKHISLQRCKSHSSEAPADSGPSDRSCR